MNGNGRKVINSAAQGDLLIRRIKELPADAKLLPADSNGRHVLAHSETGHHHYIPVMPGIVELFGSDDPLVGYVRVTKPKPQSPGMSMLDGNLDGNLVPIIHDRAWDTHTTLLLDEDVFELRRQRESTPEGWRQVMD